MTPEMQKRLSRVRKENPEWESWVDLLEAALNGMENGSAWEAAVPQPPPVSGAAPWLHGTRMHLDRRVARRWVRSLLKRARKRQEAPISSLGRLKTRSVDALELLEAAVRQEDGQIDELAVEADAEPEALRVVAQIAAMPLLQACGRSRDGHLPNDWSAGYCPVCGAWPALAEFRGIERKRWLRCGRCGTGWEITWLRCPFCGEADHEHLGYLAPEDEGHDRWRVDVCRTCNGYVKGMTTVRETPPWAVLLEDLASVHLDLVALDRGFRKPDEPGYKVDARIQRRGRSVPGLPGLSSNGSAPA